MAFDSGFDFEELSDYEKRLIKIAEKDYPKACERFMRKEAGNAVKHFKQHAKGVVKRQTGNYLKGFKKGRKVYEWIDAKYNILVHNTAPHAHLIENGHRAVTKDGKDTGKFVPGKHIVENASKTFEKQYAKDIEDVLLAQIEKEMSK